MPPGTSGLHHVTSIVGDAQQNVDFYAGVLGLRLVKRTVNFEDILQYHLYYGNETGDPGTVLTAFPSPEADPGRVGKPQPSAAAFAIPPESVDHWQTHLEAAGVDVFRGERFEQAILAFSDPDGTPLHLVGTESRFEPWWDGPVPGEHAIRGLHGVTILPADPYGAAGVLETLGFELAEETEALVRYRVAADGPDTASAAVVDIDLSQADYGREGTGTHHHIAVTMPDEDTLHEWHAVFRDRGYDVSRVKDRHYFHSLYVRGPGGVLVELATTTPGITAGEDIDELGDSLSLPDWFEHDRDLIVSQLPALDRPTNIEFHAP